MITEFIAGLIYRAALAAQQRGLLSSHMVYPPGEDDAFRVLLKVMRYEF